MTGEIGMEKVRGEFPDGWGKSQDGDGLGKLVVDVLLSPFVVGHAGEVLSALEAIPFFGSEIVP
jgi:hypothetical protein